MDADELLEFQFHRWWPRFQQVAYPARFVTLDRAVVDWLVADGVTVDDRHAAIPKRPARDEYDTDSDDDWEDGPSGSSSHLNQGSQDGNGTGARAAGDAGCSSGSEGSAAAGAAAATETVKHCRFPELERQVERCLTELGGRVVAKLNWSCPTDAVWVTTRQRLVCHSADEILLMLKSSDRIAHDICNAFEDCSAPPSAPVDYVLGLRKAFDLKPEREFRCFVHGHRLVGASQRDVTQFFPQLAGLGDSIKQSILDFHAQHVSDAFPVPDYVMDLYVASNGRVRLLDFNPIAPTTHPLLFDWQELPYARMRQPAAEDDVDNDAGREAAATAPEGSEWEVRLIEEPGALRPGAAMAFGLPLELSGAMGGLDELIDRLRRDCTANPPEDDVP